MMDHISSPLVAETLGDEQWYGDDAPRWEKAPTSNQARHRRRCCVKRIRRLGKGQHDAENLADLLDECVPGNRCMSGACPECSRAIQRWFVANVRRLIHAPDRHSSHEPAATSVVFPDSSVDPDDLDKLAVTNIRRRFTEVVKAIGGTDWLVGGFDISLNDDTAKGLGICWQLQLYGVAKVHKRISLSEGLRTHYLPCPRVRRPVQTKISDGSRSAISYGFKTDFVRRVTYWGAVGAKGKPRKCWRTRKVSLKPREHLELLLWLHKTGLAGRLYLLGVRMTRTRNGVALVEIRRCE
jgi:hypothetical protein